MKTEAAHIEAVECAIKELLDRVKPQCDESLFSAVEYALTSGGKRVRPVLCLMTSEILGIKTERVMPLALAIECIHTYSLIHDDLPAMDDSDTRRGRPSVHKAYGEAVALLAGDTLLNLAYEILFEQSLIDKALLEAASYIADAAGYRGMAGGQADELTLEKNRESLENGEQSLLEMYRKKTGALIAAAVYSPCLIAPKNEEKAAIMLKIAYNAGLIFQLADDLIDYQNGEDTGKLTFVNLYGPERAKVLIAENDIQIADLLLSLGASGNILKEYLARLSARLY